MYCAEQIEAELETAGQNNPNQSKIQGIDQQIIELLELKNKLTSDRERELQILLLAARTKEADQEVSMLDTQQLGKRVLETFGSNLTFGSIEEALLTELLLRTGFKYDESIG